MKDIIHLDLINPGLGKINHSIKDGPMKKMCAECPHRKTVVLRGGLEKIFARFSHMRHACHMSANAVGLENAATCVGSALKNPE